MTELAKQQTTDRSENDGVSPPVSLSQFQQLIREMYFEKDVARGIPGTFMWFMEEVGELSSALRECDPALPSQSASPKTQKQRENLAEEFADVLAWLATMANVAGVDLDKAVKNKYGSGCPGCHRFLCNCPDSEKP